MMVSVRKNIKRMLLFEYIRYRFAVVFLSNQGIGVMLAISRKKNVNRGCIIVKNGGKLCNLFVMYVS